MQGKELVQSLASCVGLIGFDVLQVDLVKVVDKFRIVLSFEIDLLTSRPVDARIEFIDAFGLLHQSIVKKEIVVVFGLRGPFLVVFG